jgi:hypothetical protein
MYKNILKLDLTVEFNGIYGSVDYQIKQFYIIVILVNKRICEVKNKLK